MKNPKLPAGKPAIVPSTGNIAYTDNFDTGALACRWIGLRKPATNWFALSKKNKALYLQPRADLLSGQGNPSFLAVRQQNNDFTCGVTLTTQPKTVDCTAGLAAYQNEGHFYTISVKIAAGQLAAITLEQPAGGGGGRGFGGRGGGSTPPRELATEKLPANLASIRLEFEGAGPVTKAFYTIGKGHNSHRVQLGQDLQSSFLSTDTAGGFQGVTLGMFALSNP